MRSESTVISRKNNIKNFKSKTTKDSKKIKNSENNKKEKNINKDIFEILGKIGKYIIIMKK